jgi:uncharacterized protein (DUF362 family)
MRTRLTRRSVIAAGAVALSGCAGTKLPNGTARRAEAPVVSVVRQPGYTQDIYETVRRLLAGHRLNVRGKTVVLKPNLVEFEAGSVINTNPILVHAAMEAFKAMGALSVRIAEGPGHRRGTLDLADAAGYFKTIPGFEDLFTDLNLDDVSRIEFAHPVSRLRSLYLPHTALSCDLLVSMPKMKTHHWAIATLSMKNLFGVVPGGVYGWPKNVLHWAGIAECITDIQTIFPRTFALVDGIVGMEGNGPIQGTAKASGVIVAGRDMAAVDATCCRLMRIDPLRVEYLRLLSRAGADLAEKAILQDGESISGVSTSFELLPQFRSARLSGDRAERIVARD